MRKAELQPGEYYRVKLPSGEIATARYNGAIRDKGKTRFRVTLEDGTAVYLKTSARFLHLTNQFARIDFKPKSTPKPEKKAGSNPEALKKMQQNRKPAVSKAPHVIVIARAGTGKTTTLVEGLKLVKRLKTRLRPSEQQEAVWSQMRKSSSARTVCFVAFNKSIATELQDRVPKGCDAMTMHSLGYKAVRKAFGKVRVNSFRTQDIISELLETDVRSLRRDKIEVLGGTEKLVDLCKMSLTEPTREGLAELASYYDVDLNGSGPEVFALVPRVLERCKDVSADRCISFADMIWLPVVLGLPLYRYDLLLVDEAQDLNCCQQELAQRSGKRLILCGDPKQAIYGFAGADTESMSRLHKRLSEESRGCVELPLTVTRRCGKAIVEEAKALVPDFAAHETTGEGSVKTVPYCSEEDVSKPPKDNCDYRSMVEKGDMILSRVNAPLTSECFKFLKQGRKARIIGRDFGQGLISTVRKLMKGYIPPQPQSCEGPAPEMLELQKRLEGWLYQEQQKEQNKRHPSETRLIALSDRHNCLMHFIAESCSVEDLIDRIDTIFTEAKDNPEITLSSVHKAKGLEADRVFLLRTKDAPIPHPMARSDWAIKQEYNLLYVAITRARNELVYVV